MKHTEMMNIIFDLKNTQDKINTSKKAQAKIREIET